MSDGYRSAGVFVQGIYAGVLAETEDGYEFKYSEDYMSGDGPLAVSLTLPLRKEPYKSKVLMPFFDGLIPEGWLLDLVHHNWKIDLNDRFGLLLATCRDSIGDVEIRGEL